MNRVALCSVVAADLIMMSCSRAPDTVTSATIPSSGDAAASARMDKEIAEINHNLSKWDYDNVHDAMRDKDTPRASLVSDDSANFGFPYGDSSRLYLVVAKGNYGVEAYVEIKDGQVDCSYDGCIVSVKFGNGKVSTWSGHEASSGVSNVIFIGNPESLISKLKKTKTFSIEVPIYRHGATQFSFSSVPLLWPPVASAK